MFVLLGTNGQDLFVDPESKLVMVHTAVRKLAGFNPKSPEVTAILATTHGRSMYRGLLRCKGVETAEL
jgi:hypothetical protein